MKSRSGSFPVRLLKRLSWAALTLFGTILVTWGLLYAMPNVDPARLVAGPRTDPETLAAIRRQLGLDLPRYQQFWLYLVNLAHGNWGQSSFTRKEVLHSILERFPATAELAISGLAIYLLIGIPLGVWTARHKNGWQDKTVLVVGIMIISLPIFYLARMLQYGIAYRAGVLPVAGMGGISHLIMPALTLGLVGGVYYSRLLHSSIVDVLAQDYVRAARARGLTEGMVLRRHVLRNALIPVATQLGMDVAGLLGGVIFTENVFGWPGIGTLAVKAIFQLDVRMILGTVLFAAIIVVTANIIVDLLYPLLDPRIQKAL